MKKRILSFLVMFLLVIQLVPGFAAGAVQLTVPSEFSIDGNTSYDLTISEYLRLLDTVHSGIQAELDAMCEGFPHFDSIKPNDGCTVFTVTVNSTALTAEEKGAENRMYEMRDQMAAYLAEDNNGIQIDYKTQNDTLLSSSKVGVSALLLLEEAQVSAYQSGSPSKTSSQPKTTPTPTPAPTPVPAPTPAPSNSETTCSYILNKNTKKFHYPWCKSVNQMKEKNKWYYDGTRSSVIDMGYKPCGNCHP